MYPLMMRITLEGSTIPLESYRYHCLDPIALRLKMNVLNRTRIIVVLTGSKRYRFPRFFQRSNLARAFHHLDVNDS
jgi:hypothetical protein